MHRLNGRQTVGIGKKCLQVCPEFLRSLIPFFRILFDTAGNDIFQHRRQIRAQFVCRRGFCLQMHPAQFRRIMGIKRQFSRDQFIHGDPERINIGADIAIFRIQRLFRRSVFRRTQSAVSGGFRLITAFGTQSGIFIQSDLCQPQIGKFADTILCQHDIIGFHIPVNDPRTGSLGQCGTHRTPHFRHACGRKRPGIPELFIKGSPGNIFQHKIRRAIRHRTEVIHTHHILML